MEHRLAQLTWPEARQAIADDRLVILPTGATEAHGPHLPLDCDTHQAETVALRLAERVDALVAPPVAYGYSTTFERFPGTVSLSNETYQQIVFEICAGLIRQGFRRLLVLNGNRPNGTANDAVARRLVDALDAHHAFKVSAVGYWEPGAAQVHALRKSAVGGMGHAGEMETAFQLATRPELVQADRLQGLDPPLVAWDLVAPGEPSRTYSSRPDPADGHPAIFGDPHAATPESGRAFLDAVVDALAEMVAALTPSYGARG